MGIIAAVVSLALFASAATTLWWMVHAWRTPEVLEATRFDQPDGEHSMSFSLLVPARHEEAVLAATVNQLLASVYSAYEVIIIVGHDDEATSAVARALAADHPERVRVVVDDNKVKNKPKALNSALPLCKGDVVGVFDAEDQVHPKLLEHVDHAFRVSDADVVQGGVQLVNFHSSWYSLRNCLEYFFWFRSRLHLHAQKGFIPLGGNTVFVRTDVCEPPTGGTAIASPRTAIWAFGSPRWAPRWSSPTTPSWSPGRRRPTRCRVCQAANPVEPGIPAGVPQRRLEAAADASASGCWPATP